MLTILCYIYIILTIVFPLASLKQLIFIIYIQSYAIQIVFKLEFLV